MIAYRVYDRISYLGIINVNSVNNNTMCNCIDSTMMDINEKLTGGKTIIQT